MKTRAVIFLSAVLVCAPVAQAEVVAQKPALEVSVQLADEAHYQDMAERRSISQRISDKFEKARRHREQRKLIREQRRRDEERERLQEKSASEPA